jgi:hypothetical protein
VRSRILLLILSLILFGSPSPLYAALGDAPRCLALRDSPGAEAIAEANPLALELRRLIPNYDREDRDYLIRTIVFEASGEPEEGKAAVAHVILNRKKSGKWGDKIKEVVTKPWQFEPWMTKRGEVKRLSKDSPSYRRAARIADAVLTGQRPDPTSGATHFLNPEIVRERRGGSLPDWAQGEGQLIGNHTFYAPDTGEVAPDPAALFMDLIPDSTSDLNRPGDNEPELQAGRSILATGEGEEACGARPVTVTSPGQPALNMVLKDSK